MKPWLDSGACRSGRHCQVCRDLDGGRRWRGSLSKVYILPDDAPDFACPCGRDWGSLAPVPHNGLSVFSKRLAICDACGQWDRKANRCNLHPTCTRCYLRRPGAVCPDEPPKWLPA